jgi:integrase
VAGLLYGAGLRLREALDLRVKDVDLAAGRMAIRPGRRGKERTACVPPSMRAVLAAHLEAVRRQHRIDLAAGFGRAPLPERVERAFPDAGAEWGWQFVFPAARVSRSSPSGRPCRRHLDESVIQRAVSIAISRAGVPKRGSCHTLRHSCALHLLEDGHDVRTVRALLGHADLATTRMYRSMAEASGPEPARPHGQAASTIARAAAPGGAARRRGLAPPAPPSAAALS